MEALFLPPGLGTALSRLSHLRLGRRHAELTQPEAQADAPFEGQLSDPMTGSQIAELLGRYDLNDTYADRGGDSRGFLEQGNGEIREAIEEAGRYRIFTYSREQDFRQEGWMVAARSTVHDERVHVLLQEQPGTDTLRVVGQYRTVPRVGERYHYDNPHLEASTHAIIAINSLYYRDLGATITPTPDGRSSQMSYTALPSVTAPATV